MTPAPHSSSDLKQLYAARFAGKTEYRQKVWRELCAYFGKWIPRDAAVLDLGCGYCEFINNVTCGRKFGMDLNPDAGSFAAPEVNILAQDCSVEWNVPSGRLDVVFTSNFFEHLPTKSALEHTLEQAHRALADGGKLIAMGPNIKYVPGAYWDFFDHYLPLTELSLAEVLKKCGFRIDLCEGRFLPYTMSDGRQYPIWMLRAYLSLRPAWRFLGKQFLVIATKPAR
jgi:SAM-dependent methyltransferase